MLKHKRSAISTTEERLTPVIQNQSGFLFFLLPVVPKRMLFRLHKAAVAVDGTGVQCRLKLSELIVRKRDVGGAQVLKNSFKVLGARDRYHIGILVKHPGQRNLRISGVLALGEVGKHIKNRLVGRNIFLFELRNELAHVVDFLELGVDRYFARQEAARNRREGNEADVVVNSVRDDLNFAAALNHGVDVLHRGNGRHSVGFGKRIYIDLRQPPTADQTFVNQAPHGGCHFLK